MPIAIIFLLVDLAFIIHAAKTGRFYPWAYIILFVPGFGAIAYVVVELVPEWFRGPQGQSARKQVARTFNPERRYRELTEAVEFTDTIANREALAAECLALGKYAEAEGHYANILSRPLGDEPAYMLGRARAEFGLGRPADAVATLDALRERWPDYQSNDGHLLYARALEESGRRDEALEEYKALSNYFPGMEARVRHGMLLDRLNRSAEAKLLYMEVLKQMKRAPRFVRKAQGEWIDIAEKAVRG
ncbi:MAG TPA: tetratricopeptide repeat protein [Xanthobacteraceae bacterium]|nr:tetratricopeptide repeat protein [Xanthobacteraceae bacterium]